MDNRRSVLYLMRRKSFRKFLALCKKYKYLYAAVILVQLFGTADSLLLAETARRLFDGGVHLQHSQLVHLLLALGLFVTLGLIFSLLSRVLNQIVNTHIVFQMRQMVLTQLVRLSLSYHEDKHSSNANNLLYNELEVFKHFVVFDVLRLISLPFTFIAIGIYLLTVHPLLGAIAISVGPLQLLSNLVIKESYKGLVAKQQEVGGEVFYQMGETMAGIREVKMNQLESAVFSRFQKVCNEGIRLWVSVEKMEAVRDLIRVLPEKIGYLLGIGLGAVLMVQGQIGPGALVAFITLLDKASEPFAGITSIISSLQRVSSGAEKLLDLMEMEPEDNIKGIELSPGAPLIQFENVTFAYENGLNVLNHVTFSVTAGSTLALVGPSGGGKSTLVKLLYRFYTPQEGVIRINGIPIENYSINSLRSNMAAVMQDVYLFDGTIRENIAIGLADAGDPEIIRASVLSQSHEFIHRLPDQFETRVGERGIKLSQGQKQRIAIARVILRNASILVLDEPTSALDLETESMFQQDMKQWAGSSTKVIIAHRLSTIRDADCVVFLENGEISEKGSPQELLKLEGRFADFWRKQEIKQFS